MATRLNNLVGLYYAQGRYKEAGVLCQQAIAIATQTLGLNHPYTQGFHQNFQSMILRFLNSLPLEAALERLPPEDHEAYRQMRES